ncbi:Hypothetical Protein FCC1311_063642 [Hondaea fermentalgiana]|uniref:Uncharacterized protein n=1 Tax=Hondaea fermentalgiana TaxID=2315210 RepID=A0A2R5GQJ5_9STRA|nr:Hypothetical Protein FCC1311_063642 [Hondaea fermentalgiana]|eukprot:GBG30144.1 Hypothetical Protein FCC1311_063642 [Hondaea fermentalgiana]
MSSGEGQGNDEASQAATSIPASVPLLETVMSWREQAVDRAFLEDDALIPVSRVEMLRVELKCPGCKLIVVPCACCRRALVAVDPSQSLAACSLCGFLEVTNENLRRGLDLRPVDLTARTDDEVRWLQSCRNMHKFAGALRREWDQKGSELQERVAQGGRKDSDPRLEQTFMRCRGLLLAVADPVQRRRDIDFASTVTPPRCELQVILEELGRLDIRTQGATQCSDMVGMYSFSRACKKLVDAESALPRLPALTRERFALEHALTHRLQAAPGATPSRASKVLADHVHVRLGVVSSAYHAAMRHVGEALLAIQDALCDIFESPIEEDPGLRVNRSKAVRWLRAAFCELTARTMVPLQPVEDVIVIPETLPPTRSTSSAAASELLDRATQRSSCSY